MFYATPTLKFFQDAPPIFSGCHSKIFCLTYTPRIRYTNHMRNPKNSLTANSHPRQTRVSDVLALRMERDRNGTGLTRSEHMRALLEGGLARSGGVATITQTIRQWLATHEQRMGDKGTDDNQHLYSLNPMPSRGQLGEWLKLLENL